MLNNLVEFIKRSVILTFAPRKYWTIEYIDRKDEKGIFRRFFLPCLLLVFLSIFIGEMVFKSAYGFLWADTLVKAIRVVLFILLIFLASTMIMYEVSRWHHIPLSFDISKRIVIYSMTPLVLATFVTALFPFLYFLNIFSFYSLYMIYTAITTIYRVNPLRNVRFFAVLFLAVVFAYVFISLLLSMLTALIVY